MWLFMIFVAIPIVEIALFIQLGGALGLWPTLAIVVLTAVLGTHLLRQQGRAALAQLQSSINSFGNPSEPLAHGAMIIFAGALLLTPGFFTDTVGLALMVPGVRRRVFAALRTRIRTVHFEAPQARPSAEPQSGPVVEGEFTEVSPGKRPTHSGPSSGWTRH